MRIAHIESGMHLYGGAAQVRYLLEGLSAAGVDNVLIAARGGALEAAAVPARVVALPMRGDLDVGLVMRLRRVLREVQPDLVHVHSRRGAELYGGIAAALARVPAVLTRRVDAAEPAFAARWKYRPYRAIVALSRAIEIELANRVGIEPARLVRIPSAVDTARYRSDPAARARVTAAFALPADALLVGVVAQLITRKRHALLFAELPALARRYPALRVLCFGRGPLAAELERDVASRGLEPYVRLVGFRDDLPDIFPALDLLVHPAEREGLGLALLEAAACAVPVVACAAGGVVDVVEHGRTGLLVPANDGHALRAALERLLGDPAQRRRLGAAARARVQRHFAPAALTAAHLSLYERVLGGAQLAEPKFGRSALE